MVTPTKRTTAAKSDVPSFDKGRKKSKKTWPFVAFGQTWKIKQPNAALFSQYVDSGDIGMMARYLANHVVEPQREDFIKAMLADEDFEAEDAADLHTQMQEVVYADIPTPPS